jgi:hypothetical protein
VLSVEQKLKSRVYGLGRGSAFSSKDFSKLGSRDSVDQALHSLWEKGFIRRLRRGIYDYPRMSTLVKVPLPPDVDQVAQAIARKFGWNIQPSGPVALNFLGLTTQVPARYVYQSDGPDRTYELEELSKYGLTPVTIEFRQTALKESGFKHPESTIIVRALKALGESRIDDEVIAKVRAWLPAEKRNMVLRETQAVTGWVYEAIRTICAGDG